MSWLSAELVDDPRCKVSVTIAFLSPDSLLSSDPGFLPIDKVTWTDDDLLFNLA